MAQKRASTLNHRYPRLDSKSDSPKRLSADSSWKKEKERTRLRTHLGLLDWRDRAPFPVLA
jgi:hypothetical protein